MGDVERITTTERPLRDELAQAIRKAPANNYDAYGAVDAVLPIIERELAAERVRVVEGLVATIKALDLTTEVRAEADGHAVTKFTNVDSVGLAAVLAVVEAAREATDE